VINESALLESKSLRDSVLDRTDVLDRVKALSLLPDGMHVTTAMVAAYFEVGLTAITSLVHDHREELEASGYRVLTGSELTSFKELSGIQSRTRSLALFSRRAVLNIAIAAPRQRSRTSGACLPPGHGVPGPHTACG
jgi:restriction system protein